MFALRRSLHRAADTLLGSRTDCSTCGPGLALAAARFSAAAAQAAEPLTLEAELRSSVGKITCKKLRKEGRTPGIVFSGPGDQAQLLAFESKGLERLVTKLGRTAWACSIFDLQIRGEDGSSSTVRALGRQVHKTADTDVVENVTFIHCPPDRLVRVDVPLKVIGDEVSPGIKAGGRINWIRRTIPCLARGDSIPRDFTIDISKMGLNDKLHFTDLKVPEGTQLHRVDSKLPILKVTK